MTYIQPNSPFGPAKKVGSTKDDDKAGGSNAGTYESSEGPFCGPSGGSPEGTYPIGSEKRGESAINLAHNAPNPSGIKACVYSKYPGLKKGAAQRQSLTSAERHGDITQAPSKFTQFVRGVKNAESGPKWMLKNLINTAAIIAPIPSVGKINVAKKIGKSVWNFLKSTPNQVIKSAVKGKTATQATEVIAKSKPVNFKGPNPAHKTGAGGNSYRQDYDNAVNLLQNDPAKASKLGLNPLATSIKQEWKYGRKQFVPTNPRVPTGHVGKPGIPAYSKKDPLWPKSVDEKLYPSNWPAWYK